jgi:serine/threonine protein kinase
VAPDIDGFSSLSEIGRGGFGVVYRARQDSLGRWVAVKVLPNVRGDSEAYGRFERECRALGAVSNHPSIATVYACGVAHDGSGYLALELLDGGSLADRSAAGPMDWTRVVIIGIALAGALETAHRVGVLHRDVKPQNVLFDRLGTPKLLDFGIASVPGAFQTRSAVVTLTLAHAAPEVVAGGRGTVASDVYALASTLFTAIHGAAPFNKESDETLVPLLARIAASPVPDLRAAGVPDDVATVLETALAKDPAERPRSAEEFGVALAEVLVAHGGPSLVPPVLAPQLGDAPPEPVPVPRLDEATVARVPGAVVAAVPVLASPAPAPRRTGRVGWIAAVVVALLLVAGIAHALGNGGGPSTAGPGSSSSGPVTSPGSSPKSSTQQSASHSPSSKSSVSQPSDSHSSSHPTTSHPTTSHPTSSHPTSSTAPPPPPPATPAAATANSVVGGARVDGSPTQMKVTLSWDPSTGTTAPASYQVERTTMNGSTATSSAATYTFTTTSATIAVPSLGGSTQWYRWWVRAVDSGGHHSGWRAVSARIPNFVDRQGLVAVQIARTAGLQGTLVQTPTTKPRLKGRVTAQSPGAGLYGSGQHVTIDAYAR